MPRTESVYFPDDDDELAQWIDDRVKDGIFNNFSHGVRYAIKKTKEDNVEEMV